MKLEVQNLFTKVVDASLEERAWLLEYLVFKDRVFNPWKRRYEERTTKFYNDNAGHFPAGYTRAVMSAAGEAGWRVVAVDGRTCPVPPDPAADLEWLLHHPAANVDPIFHQRDAVSAMQKRTRGIIKVPTGGGKTEIAIGAAKSIRCTWVFLVHRGDLLNQTAQRFSSRTGEEAGLIGEGEWNPKRFTVAMFQTLYSRVKAGDPQTLTWLSQVQGLLVDEVHTLAADTFREVAMRTPNAYWRFGLSATPLKHSSGRGTFVVGALGPMIYEVKAKLLQEIGVLSRPSIRFITVKQTPDRETWQGVQGEYLVRSKVRNRALFDVITRRAAKPCLVFVQQLKHGTILHQMLIKAGVKAENISGKEAVPARQAAIERLVRGDIEVLIVNVIFQEGVDIPSLASVAMAGGGASAIASLQKVGRGMRATKTKHTVEVWEIYDVGCGCNAKTKKNDPDNFHKGCQWLERHSKERIAAYRDEEYDVIVEDAQGNLLDPY